MTHARAFGFILLCLTTTAWAQREPLPLASFHGILKQIDDKSIVLNLDDERTIEFKRTGKTRFYRDGKELKTPDFKPGDALNIEGQQDPLGYLTAATVRLEKASAGAAPGKVVDTWAGGGTPSRSEPDDPGPPQLQRGRVADPSRERSTPVPEESKSPATTAPEPGEVIARQNPPAPAVPSRPSEAATTPGSSEPAAPPAAARIRPDEDLPFGASPAQDSLIRRAADAALDFSETLPNYICREVISRSQSATRNTDWRLVDTVETDLVFENGKEDYRNISVNGRRVNKKMDELGGAWSTGEFATSLRNLFSPATMTEFQFLKNSRIAGIDAREYSFSVKQERSMWDVRAESQSYSPAYNGRIWIDPSNARALRIEMEATAFPAGFPFDRVETSTDYEYVRLGGTAQYLLPVRAAMLGCQRGTYNCFRNNIDFRNYRKFEAESSIQYEDRRQQMF